MRLAGKVAIVTGSTAGIGKGSAELFAREGAKVVVSGRTVVAGEKVAEGIRAAGGEAIFVKADVSVTADVQRLVEETVSAYGKLDILFNNAGIGTTGLTADESEESWDRCMTVNLKSVFLGIKYAVPEMIKNGGGSIVSNSSMWGITASHRCAGSYVASKAAIIGLTKKAALDYARQKIRVNCISPGDIGYVGLHRDEDYWTRPEVVEDFETRQPYPRMGTPDDCAFAALYLASDESSFVTGSNLVLDGGMTIAEILAGGAGLRLSLLPDVGLCDNRRHWIER